jgi:hypothetical protein
MSLLSVDGAALLGELGVSQEFARDLPNESLSRPDQNRLLQALASRFLPPQQRQLLQTNQFDLFCETIAVKSHKGVMARVE